MRKTAVVLTALLVSFFLLGTAPAFASDEKPHTQGRDQTRTCTKIEDSEIGSATFVTVGETRVQISRWDTKPDEPNEFIGFAWNADGVVSVTVKAGPERYDAGEGTSGAWTSPPTGKNGTQKAISYIKFCGEEPPVEEPPVDEPSEEPPAEEPPVEEPPVDELSEEPVEEPLDELPILPVTGPTYDIFGFTVDLYAIAGFAAGLILMGSALLIAVDEAKRAKFALAVHRVRRIGFQLLRPRGSVYVFSMPQVVQRIAPSRPWSRPRKVVSRQALMLNGAWRFG